MRPEQADFAITKIGEKTADKMTAPSRRLAKKPLRTYGRRDAANRGTKRARDEEARTDEEKGGQKENEEHKEEEAKTSPENKGTLLAYFSAKPPPAPAQDDEPSDVESEPSPRPAKKPCLDAPLSSPIVRTRLGIPRRIRSEPTSATSPTTGKRKKEKIQTTISMPGDNFRECKICDTLYNPLHPEDVKCHARRHRAVLRAKAKKEAEAKTDEVEAE